MGRKAVFECSAKSVGKWLHNNKSLPRNAKFVGNKLLEIDNVRLHNKGVYECEGIEKNNKIFYAQGTLIIQGNSILVII